MTSLTQILASLACESGAYRVQAGEDWAQGRTLFGGLIAALANEAMCRAVPTERTLRAFQIVYVGPNAPGEIHFVPKELRAGKAMTLASCEVRSQGETTATVTAMYGTRRESILNLRPMPAQVTALPQDLADADFRGNLPSFTQHYHQRWAVGAPLFSRASDSQMSVYLRYRDEPNARCSRAHALALMDAIPTPALALLDKASPASTLSWTLEFLDTHFDFGMDEWWRLDAWVDAAAEGYVVHSSHVVNPAGKVAAISRQVVVVYG
jgi:acyl-CoA thioesterase